MSLTPEEIRGAQQARRLLADSVFQDVIQSVRQLNVDRAIMFETPDKREAARQVVLALDQLVGELQGAVALLDSDAERERLAREFEDVEAVR